MTNFFRYAKNTADTTVEPSGAIWQSCPVEAVDAGAVAGVHIWDNFERVTLPGTQTSEVTFGLYKAYNTGNGTVITNSSLDGTQTMGGILSMLCDTDGDASAFGTHSCPFRFSGSASTSGKLWFEARIAVTGIATNNIQLFVGFGENNGYTFGAAKPLANANAVANDVPFIGLQMNEDGVGVVRGVYTDEATSWTEVEDNVGTLAASTWAKVGLIYNPDDATNCVKFYFNGVPAASVLSRSTLTGLTNLDASPMGLLFAAFADSAGTSTYAYMDWWKCVQLNP